MNHCSNLLPLLASEFFSLHNFELFQFSIIELNFALLALFQLVSSAQYNPLSAVPYHDSQQTPPLHSPGHHGGDYHTCPSNEDPTRDIGGGSTRLGLHTMLHMSP